MRNTILIACALLLCAAPASAQVESYLEMLRQDMRAEKVAVVTETMDLTDEQAELFWPIYREYDHARTELNDKTLQLIKDYAAAFETMDDAQAKDILSRAMKLDNEERKLQEKYIKQMQKKVGAVVAARFYQVDNQVGRLIDIQIGANLPLMEAAPPAPSMGSAEPAKGEG
jgi:hypothetical protein